MSDIGTRIKKYRKLKKLTQKQLGQLSNTSETTIKQYETGKRQPRIEQLQKIANVLSVQVTDLITGYHNHYEEDRESVSPEHPIAFPGLEKKLTEIGYGIFYGCDYAEYSDDEIWIECPDGKKVFLTLSELENLNWETDLYIKFRIDQLRDKKP